MSTFYKIKDRIEELAIILGKTVAELEKGDKKDFPGKDDRLLGNATISGWYEQPLVWTSATLEKFLTYYRVSREWWKTGEGEPILTSVDKASDNKEKPPESIYRDLVESNSEYRLVPKIILDNYEIIPKRELEERAAIVREALDAKNYAIAQLEKEIASLRSREVTVLHAEKAQ